MQVQAAGNHLLIRVCGLTIAVALLLGAVSVRPASASAILIGNGTFNTVDDLTVIQTGGGRVLQFLDLTFTNSVSVATALATYASSGFRWANGSEIADLLDAFGMPYSVAPNVVTQLGPSNANFASHLGANFSSGTSIGWIDDLTTSTLHSYLCVGSGCMGTNTAFTNNTNAFWPSTAGAGVLLVRDAVPEPASLLLLGTGLALVAARWRSTKRT